MSTPNSLEQATVSDDGRYNVTTDQFRNFRRDGFVVVRGLVPDEHIEELRQHTDDLMQGRLPEQTTSMAARDTKQDGGVTVQGLEAPPKGLSPYEKAQHYLRIHMLHRCLELHERYLLHPRVLDVLEAIIGPDVMAMQSMLFLKPPGKPGQGWHQDSYYIPTYPDTLCGAWIAIDDCDEFNGAMWMAKGSGHEPVHPPCPEYGYGFGDRFVSDVQYVKGVSETVDDVNDLSKIAAQYDQVLLTARAGDVVFFNGHVLHRSKQNVSTDRCRRAFVGHYANARSFTQWGSDEARPRGRDDFPARDEETGMTNGSHILARGNTHLPFAKPAFGTECAALHPKDVRKRQSLDTALRIAAANHGLEGCAMKEPVDPEGARANVSAAY